MAIHISTRWLLVIVFLVGVGIGWAGRQSRVKIDQSIAADIALESSWLKAEAYDMPKILYGLKNALNSNQSPKSLDIEYLVANDFLPKVSDIWFCPVFLNVDVKGGTVIEGGDDAATLKISKGSLLVHYWYSPYYLEEKDGKIFVKSKMFPSIEDFWIEYRK